MRIAAVLMVVALAGCGNGNDSEAAAIADEALADARRAHDRADDLEARIQQLESDLESEVREREFGDSNLDNEVRNHTHYY